MDRRRMLLGGGFPKEPSDYEIIGTFFLELTFTAPKDGYYQIEVFGASGSGGKGNAQGNSTGIIYLSGGGGGGGGYACSRVMLKKGNTVVFTPGGIGSDSTAAINSSKEEYEAIKVTSGANGGDWYHQSGLGSGYYSGDGGAGGVAFGGNYSNANGYAGGKGNYSYSPDEGDGWYDDKNDGYGGASGHPDGNVGGHGGEGGRYPYTGEAGKAGFIRISAGNTN